MSKDFYSRSIFKLLISLVFFIFGVLCILVFSKYLLNALNSGVNKSLYIFIGVILFFPILKMIVDFPIKVFEYKNFCLKVRGSKIIYINLFNKEIKFSLNNLEYFKIEKVNISKDKAAYIFILVLNDGTKIKIKELKLSKFNKDFKELRNHFRDYGKEKKFL